MSLIATIQKLIYIMSVNSRIKKAKYIHIMFNDKFNKPFVDFLNRNFNPKEHLILCKNFYEFPFPEGDNVIELKYLYKLKFNNVQKLICHSLFDNDVIDYLYEYPDILKNKAYWMIWGGDLYDAVRDEKNDFVRANFKGYISDTDGDCEIAMKKYNSHPETYNAGYTFPITKEMLRNSERISHNYIQIQINNSSDKSTLDMLDILAKFKDENIKVTTVLSYGEMDFKEEIIKKGREIFGDKFDYYDKYLSPSEFAQKMAQNDILILNQNRQQGIGNCFVNLALGTKVFIKSEVTTFNHFNSKGIKIFDTNLIENLDFNSFTEYPKEVLVNNINKSQMFFDDDYLKSLWTKILNKIEQ